MSDLHAEIELVLGDCLEGMTRLPARSIDVIVTSPPYNIGSSYRSYADRLRDEVYHGWLTEVGRQCERLLAPEGSFFLNLGGPPSDPLKPLAMLASMQHRLTVQNVIHWVKSASVDDGPVRGHQKPVNSPRYLNGGHEYLFHLTKSGAVTLDKLAVGVPYADRSNLKRGTRGKNGDRRDRGNVWFIPYHTIQRRDRDRPHPATFPVELADRCLRLHGLARIRRAMDPFLGLGSSAVAAAHREVPFVGFEMDPVYLEVARARVAGLSVLGPRGES